MSVNVTLVQFYYLNCLEICRFLARKYSFFIEGRRSVVLFFIINLSLLLWMFSWGNFLVEFHGYCGGFVFCNFSSGCVCFVVSYKNFFGVILSLCLCGHTFWSFRYCYSVSWYSVLFYICCFGHINLKPCLTLFMQCYP
jgi:hypothetical protein